MVKRLIPIALALIAAGLVPAQAHHSLSIYNRNTSRTVEGVVESFSWTNPHVRIVLMVQGSGGAEQWDFEGGSVNRLANSGFNRAMIAPGDKIAVSYNPRRDGSHGGFFVRVKNKDGRTYSTRRLPNRGGAEEG